MSHKNNCNKHQAYMKIMVLILLLGTPFLYSCTRQIPKPNNCFHHPFAAGATDRLHCTDEIRYVDASLKSQSSQTLSSAEEITALLATKKHIISIRTDKQGEPVKISTGAGKLNIDSQVSFINQYYILNYKIIGKPITSSQKLISRLLGKIKDFKGFPDTVYNIVPHFEGNHLTLYRVANKDKVPYIEYSSAIKLGANKIATPLVGYPVKYCRAEQILNANNELTGQYRPVCEGVGLSSAEYFQVGENNKKVFQYVPKVDIFPSNFFDGTWLAARMLIGTNEEISNHLDMGGVGAQQAVAVVEFRKQPKRLMGIETSGGQYIKEKDKYEAFSIPVQWKEYESSIIGTDIAHFFGEQESEKTKDTERAYFQIDFYSLLDNFDSSTVLKDVTIADNYFSYTYEFKKDAKYEKIKVAFKKIDVTKTNTYREKKFFEHDSANFFPMLSTQRSHYVTISDYTKKDIEKYYRVVRHNPQKKVIKWYFSKQTPRADEVRNFGRQAIAIIDTAYTKAAEGTGKTPIRIVLDESEDKELGDVRFNIINYIESESRSFGRVVGYGPRVHNPTTGEIISGTANIYFSKIIEGWSDELRGYIRFSLFPPLWKWSSSSIGGSPFIDEKIQELCPEVDKFIADKKKENKSFNPINLNLNDSNIIQYCAKELSKAEILFTTLHEMQHSLSGLRHVFSASVDKDNFYKNYEEIEKIFGKQNVLRDSTTHYSQPAQYASVMDYPAISYPYPTFLTRYDISAIRFVYYNHIETKDGKLIEVPDGADQDPKHPQKSIQQTLDEKGLQIKPYKVCGGKIWVNPRTNSDLDINDPLCQQMDYGTTPLGVVKNYIQEMKNILMAKIYRYDSHRIPINKSYIFSMAKNLTHFLIKWGEERNDALSLLASSPDSIYRYSHYQPENFAKYKRTIEEKSKRSPEFNEYYTIRQPIFDFFKEIIFMPTQRCIYQKENGDFYSESLEKIKLFILFELSSVDGEEYFVRNCLSPLVEEWAEKNKLTFLSEVGFSPTPQSYFLLDREENPIDVETLFSPIKMTKKEVGSIVEKKTNSRLDTEIVGLFILLLEEPDLAYQLLQEIQKTILNGTDITPYINDSRVSAKIKSQIPRFITMEDNISLKEHIKNIIHKYGLNMTRNTSHKVSNQILEEYGCQRTLLYDLINNMRKSLNYKFFNSIIEQNVINQRLNLENFMQDVITHPKVYTTANDRNQICFPVVDNETDDRFIAQVILKYNQLNECINNPTSCEDIEQKLAWSYYLTQLIELNWSR